MTGSHRELVTTEMHVPTTAPTPRVVHTLLEPRLTPARTGRYFQRILDANSVSAALHSASSSKYLAVDYETNGFDYTLQMTIIGVGLAWDTGSVYIPFDILTDATYLKLQLLVFHHQGLLAHNVYFDGGVTRECLSVFPTQGWHACTLALYRLISNEGQAGQQYGLKSAMVDILGWENSNDIDLNLWLVSNGYYNGQKRKDESPEVLRQAYLDGTIRPKKEDLWRAPQEIVGKYCVLDAEACYLLYTEHFLPVLERFPDLRDIFHTEWMPLIDIHITQKIQGIGVDRDLLLRQYAEKCQELDHLEFQFRSHPETRDHILDIEARKLQELLDKEPPSHKKKPEAPKEPSKFKKDGDISKSYTNWLVKIKEWEEMEPEISKTWLNWKERLEKARRGEMEEYRFGVGSILDMRELLYDRLGNDIRITTDSGLPGLGSDALRHMGEVGKILTRRDETEKEIGFLEKYIELTELRNSLHPNFSLPGTSTGRLSGSNPNFQQLPKTKRMMDLFVARPGHVFVDLDFRALENVVAAELSEDPNLYNLYGDDVPENDSHLFLAAHIGSWKEAIEATGYTPYNPPPGSVAKAKKEVKSQRSKAKTVVYACISKGTLIRIKNKGLIPIEKVVGGDQVWDGDTWVTTDGAKYMGDKIVQEFNGIYMTPDHKLLGVDNEWREMREYREIQEGGSTIELFRPRKPSSSWSDLWQLVCSLFRG